MLIEEFNQGFSGVFSHHQSHITSVKRVPQCTCELGWKQKNKSKELSRIVAF